MFATNLRENSNGKRKHLRLLTILLLTAVTVFFTMGETALAKKRKKRRNEFCTQTAQAAYKACLNEITDDYNIAVGNCINVSDDEEREDCFNDAKKGEDGYRAAKEECKDQYEARREVCEDLGEDRYDPQLDLEDFNSPLPNPYFPLDPGTFWYYESETDEGTETDSVAVTNDTIKIEYPEDSGQFFTCIVVSDKVKLGGELIEDTDDYYAVDNDGNVWYFGETARNYENGRLANLEGSWIAGVDGAKPGILMQADPDPENEDQNPYRQEFALGDAEDLAEVVSRHEAVVDVPFGSWDEGDDVVETRDFSPLEPDVEEFKYYVPNIGLVLEVNFETGERVELFRKGTLP